MVTGSRQQTRASHLRNRNASGQERIKEDKAGEGSDADAARPRLNKQKMVKCESMPDLKKPKHYTLALSPLNIFNTIDNVYNPYSTKSKIFSKRPSLPPILLRKTSEETGGSTYELEMPRYPLAQKSVKNSLIHFSSHRAKLCNLYNDIRSIDIDTLPRRKFDKF